MCGVSLVQLRKVEGCGSSAVCLSSPHPVQEEEEEMKQTKQVVEEYKGDEVGGGGGKGEIQRR